MQEIQDIKYMQYMWIKHKLLEWMKPYFFENMKNKDWYVLDIMSWSCSVSSFFKPFFKVMTNDVQHYSYTISKSIIENDNIFPKKEILEKLIEQSKNQKKYLFFEKNYSDTYFTKKVCQQIDSISYEIDKLEWTEKYIYKYILILSMNKVRLTTGHYAQYLKKEHPRMKIFLKRDLFKQMFVEIENFKLNKNYWKNISFNHEDKNLIEKLENEDISLIYLDPPYSGEQYSRFYHVLETATKYDNPEINKKIKWLYRNDRFKSDFCYKNRWIKSFEKIFKFWNKKWANIIISYSDKWIISINDIEKTLKKYYKDVDIKSKKHFHSSLSKGASELNEILIIWKNAITKSEKKKEKKEKLEIKFYEKDLIRYLWNKRKLLKEFHPIFDELYNNGNKTFIDLFSWSWAIARLAKWIWFKATANDWEDYSYIINKTFLEFDIKKHNFSKVWWLEKILEELNNLKIKKGFFYNNFWEKSKLWRKFFTENNSWKIDSINDHIDKLLERELIKKIEYYYLKTSLILAISKYANITGIFRAYLKQFSWTSQKNLILEKVFVPKWLKWKAIKSDAEKYKANADIVYIDPPYNEHQYSPNYHILNHIHKIRPKLNWVAWVYDYSETKSNFCNEKWSKKWVENLLKNIKAKYILFSYNNNWLIRVWDLYDMLSKYWNTEIKIVDYPRYRAHSARTPLLNENYEYLFICEVWKKINKIKYNKNIELLKKHPWYNRRRKDDKWRYEQRKWI